MTDVNVTQAGLEHWLTTNPNVQTTQVALEHWATVSSAPGTQLTVTQVAVEHWASVRAVSLGAPMVTIIG